MNIILGSISKRESLELNPGSMATEVVLLMNTIALQKTVNTSIE